MPVMKYTLDGVNWERIEGAPGPAGPTGPAGQDGATGPTGPAAPGLEVISGIAVPNVAGGWGGVSTLDKQGRMVVLTLGASKDTWAGSEVMCNLPPAYCPTIAQYFTCLVGASGGYNFGYVQPNGAVVIGFAATGGVSVLGTVAFMAAA